MNYLKINTTKFQVLSICFLILIIFIVISSRFSNPYDYVYKAWNNSGTGAVYNVLVNIKEVVPENEYNSLIKSLLLNHSEPYVVKIASRQEFTNNNDEIIKIVQLSEQLFIILDTNIYWRGSSNKTVLNRYSSKDFFQGR